MCKVIKFKEAGRTANCMGMLKYNTKLVNILKANIKMEFEFKVLFDLMIKLNTKVDS